MLSELKRGTFLKQVTDNEYLPFIPNMLQGHFNRTVRDFLKFSINKASRRLYCPVCGRPMSMNLRMDHTFVEDEGWHQAAERYSEFLEQHKRQKTLFLDLGTGMNTPGIIKYPF